MHAFNYKLVHPWSVLNKKNDEQLASRRLLGCCMIESYHKVIVTGSVGETAVNLTSGYELVRMEIESGGMWTDATQNYVEMVRKLATRWPQTMQKQKSWWQELVPTSARDDPPELWAPGFADRKYVRNFGTVLWPSLPRPRALRLDLDCGL
jgi:hypothetical protein